MFQKERRETLAKLKSDWNLFIIYTKLLDAVRHLFWQKDKIVEKYYKMVDEFAGEIQFNLPENTLMIILSDHGMQRLKGTLYQGGRHSFHSFASLSQEVEAPKPLKITDFYSIVCNHLQKEENTSF